MRGCKGKGVDKERCTINECVIFQQKVLYNSEKMYSNVLYCGLFHNAVSGVGNLASMGEWVAYTGFWWGHLRERNHLGDPGVDGRITLR
jgi:hypothetical protein